MIKAVTEMLPLANINIRCSVVLLPQFRCFDCLLRLTLFTMRTPESRISNTYTLFHIVVHTNKMEKNTLPNTPTNTLTHTRTHTHIY